VYRIYKRAFNDNVHIENIKMLFEKKRFTNIDCLTNIHLINVSLNFDRLLNRPVPM
jgi:hypothetical protein